MKILKLPLLILAGLSLFILSCQNKNGSQDSEQQDVISLEDDSLSMIEPKNSPGLQEDYKNTNRVIWQKPEMVMNLLSDLENKTVADIGAGTGFFALRVAQRAKKVIAIDIDPRFVNYLDSVKVLELPESIQKRLETRLARPDDPLLKPGEADIIMIVNTFIYIKDQRKYLEHLRNILPEGGKLLIIDFKKKRTPIGPPSEIRLPVHVVEEMLYSVGFKNIVANDTALDYQYIVTAWK
jgi:ubiquinone/menaquinone biosynthesis C-methylase UbiE